MATEAVYAEEMHPLGQGFALWQADPLGDYKQVNVGDVGYLQ